VFTDGHNQGPSRRLHIQVLDLIGLITIGRQGLPLESNATYFRLPYQKSPSYSPLDPDLYIIAPQKEVQVDKDGREVIRLKGPWQVCVVLLMLFLAADTGMHAVWDSTLAGGASSALLPPRKRFLYERLP
jgi:hypothetical protein